MPELPEMETYRRHLVQHCSGRRVTNLTVAGRLATGEEHRLWQP